MELYAKGKRSLIYKENNLIIKKPHPNSKAINRMENEAHWLKILNKHNIGPRFLKLEKDSLYIEFIEGTPLVKYECKKKELINLLKDLLKQCYTMDELKVNKFEMHHPTKHALVRKNKIILIDFERCKFTHTPKNVTQVCQFIARNYNLPELLEKAKAYKQTYSKKAFEDICKALTNII
jgi:predicted Ser/Thr protein kinase